MQSEVRRSEEHPAPAADGSGGAAVYAIVVGVADLASFEAAFPGSRINVGSTRATLRWRVADQAALFLVLDRVFEVGLDLLGLQKIEARAGAAYAPA